MSGSERGSEQAAHTFDFIGSVNLTGASVDIIDQLVVGAFRSSS